jgi:hypothetical protein
MQSPSSNRVAPVGRGPDPRDHGFYQIRVRGCLDSTWSQWFEGLAVVIDQQHGETILSGLVPDQAALHGLLNKVRNLGLPLLGLTHQDSNDEVPAVCAADDREDDRPGGQQGGRGC